MRTARLLTAALTLLTAALALSTAMTSPSADAATESASMHLATATPPVGRATFGIGPAASSTARGLFTYQSGPGGRYDDKAVVANYGSTPLPLTVYAADLGNDSTGSVVVGNGAAGKGGNTGAGAWLSLGAPTLHVTVPARTARGPGARVIPFSFHVPGNAEPGDHGAALVAVLSSIGRDSKGIPIRLNQRIAARVYIRVSGTLAPGLSVENLSTSYDGTWVPFGAGAATLRYTVRNTGNIRLGATQLASVAGTWGSDPLAVTAPKIPLLFPGASQRFTVRVKGVTPSFGEHARVVVTPVLLPDEPVLAFPKAQATSEFTAVPWPLIALAVIVVALVLGVVLLARRNRRRRRARSLSGRTSHRRARRGAAPPAQLSVRHFGVVMKSIVTAALSLTAAVLAGTPAASAASVPFTDPAQKGYVGLCDASGHQMMSGSVGTHPFAVRAVGSSAAPAQYSPKKGGKATLYAFQPRQGTDPGDWSGRQLTASSFYSNAAHPMAAGTELDYSLGDYLSIYPARWDGLVQLRLFLSVPNAPVLLDQYAATTIQVRGSRWSVVQGGTVDCSAGKATSIEDVNLTPTQRKALAAAARRQRAAATSVPGATSASSTGAGSAGATGGVSAGSGSGSASDVAQGPGRDDTAAARSAASGGGGALWWFVAAVVAVGGAGAVLVVRRRRAGRRPGR